MTFFNLIKNNIQFIVSIVLGGVVVAQQHVIKTNNAAKIDAETSRNVSYDMLRETLRESNQIAQNAIDNKALYLSVAKKTITENNDTILFSNTALIIGGLIFAGVIVFFCIPGLSTLIYNNFIAITGRITALGSTLIDQSAKNSDNITKTIINQTDKISESQFQAILALQKSINALTAQVGEQSQTLINLVIQQHQVIIALSNSLNKGDAPLDASLEAADKIVAEALSSLLISNPQVVDLSMDMLRQLAAGGTPSGL